MDNHNFAKNRFIGHINLFDLIISKTNLLRSWQEFKIDKRNKMDAQIFEHNLVENLFALHFDLKNRSYRHGRYISFYIHDPKLRHIHKASVRDRILHHAIMKQIEPYFERSFIFDSYSSRVGKGTHRAVLRLRDFAWKLSRNNTNIVWALKCDIRKFFDSIDHEILFRLIRDKISDEATLGLIKEIIDSFPLRLDSNENKSKKGDEPAKYDRGTPLGNLTSQLFSNIYLNPLDNFVKRILKERFYLRYADDFVILSCERNHLESLIPKLRSFLTDTLKLELHPEKINIRKWSQGIDFLGYVVFPHHIILRTKTKKRMFRNIQQNYRLVQDGLMSKEKFRQSLQSYLGILKHCRKNELQKKIKRLLSNPKSLSSQSR